MDLRRGGSCRQRVLRLEMDVGWATRLFSYASSLRGGGNLSGSADALDCAGRRRDPETLGNMPTAAEDDQAPSEAEVLRFFDLFLEGKSRLEDRQETQDDVESEDAGWEKLQTADDEDDEDKESLYAASSVSSSSEATSGAATSSSGDERSKRGGRVGASPSRKVKRGGKMSVLPPIAPPRSTSTHYQHRQRQELDYLKGKVRELELKLRHLEREAVISSARDGSMWQRVAQQQQVASQKAIAENAQLRIMVEEQLKFSKTLEKAIRKRPFFGGGEEGERGAPRPRRQSATTTANLVNSLRSRVAHAHQVTERVMNESGVGKMTSDTHGFDIKTRPDPLERSNNQIRLEWINVRRMPFPFAAVTHEIWGFLSDSRLLEQMPGLKRRVEVGEGELLATTDLVFPVGSRTALLHATAAFQLTIADNVAYINWISHGDCRAKKGTKDAFQIIEKGWTKITPLTDAGDTCIIKTVNYVTPSVITPSREEEGTIDLTVDSPSNASSPDEIGILTELFCGAYEKSLGHLYAVIQNALMARTLQDRSQRSTSTAA